VLGLNAARFFGFEVPADRRWAWPLTRSTWRRARRRASCPGSPGAEVFRV